MNNSVGEAVFTIKLNTNEAQAGLQLWQSNLDNAMSGAGKSTQSLSDHFKKLASTITELVGATYTIKSLGSAIGEVTDAYNQYQSAMNGVKAVATATGNDISDSLNSIKEVTSTGLLSQQDAAAAMKNLQLYGYSVQEATEMIKIMTDAAVYNRQANYSVSEAVRVTTEGIRMENSVLSDASGVTKNIAKMHEEYAKSLGTTVDKLTDAQKAQAVYNGYMEEGGIFAGNAEEYTNTLAGAQQKLSTAITEVKQSIGSMFESFAPIISGIANWISENKELVTILTTLVGTLIGGGGIIAGIGALTNVVSALGTAMKTVTGASGAFGTALSSLSGSATTTSGALKVLSTLLKGIGIAGPVAAAGIVAIGTAMLFPQVETQRFGSELGKAAVLGDRVIGTMELAGDEIQQVGSNASSATSQIDKLNQSLADLERDYRRDLKKIAVSHQENLDKLTQQIEEANADYRRAIDERVADFNVSLAKEERTHQEMVDELMTQLNFLQRYNNDYNKQKLAQVQFALAKEEALYQRQTEAEKAELELQNAADKQKLDAKLASLQKELDDEIAFMEKHRDVLNSVRDVILLDEVESLREQYEQQREGIKKQIAQAYSGGVDAANAFWNGYDQVNKQQLDIHTVEVRKLSDSIESKAGQARVIDPNTLVKLLNGGFATGGYTGRGNPNEVAGVVHRGEYVIPADQVNQSTGLPKAGSNTVQNFTINLSGVLATSAQAKRELATELQRALQQTNQARLS